MILIMPFSYILLFALKIWLQFDAQIEAVELYRANLNLSAAVCVIVEPRNAAHFVDAALIQGAQWLEEILHEMPD